MFSPKIKLEKGLYERLTEIAGKGGYASVDEFIVNILEKEAEKFEDAQNDEQIQERLRGLGYIEQQHRARVREDSALMNAVNAVFQIVVGAMMMPLLGMPAVVSLCVLSVVLGVIAFIVFKYTSNQSGLERAGDRSRANMLAMMLFQDDTRASFGAVGGLFLASLQRLWCAFFPALFVLTLIFAPIMSQMAMYWQFRPLHPDERKLVEVTLNADAWESHHDMKLASLAGVDSEYIFGDPTSGRLVWRITPREAVGSTQLVFEPKSGDPITKQLVVSTPDDKDLHYINPLRPGTSFIERYLYPGEPAFSSADPVQRIEILEYPDRVTPVCGVEMHWMITSLIAMFAGAFSVLPFMKVKF